MRKTREWVDAIYLLVRMTDDEIDLSELRLTLTNTFPEINFDTVLDTDLKSIIDIGRRKIKDKRFFINTNTVNNNTGKIVVRHCSLPLLVEFILIVKENVPQFQFQFHQIKRVGSYYQIEAVFTAESACQVSSVLHRTAQTPKGRLMREINKGVKKDTHVFICTIHFQSVQQDDAKHFIKQLERKYPLGLVSSQYENKELQVQLTHFMLENDFGQSMGQIQTFIEEQRFITSKPFLRYFNYNVSESL